MCGVCVRGVCVCVYCVCHVFVCVVWCFVCLCVVWCVWCGGVCGVVVCVCVCVCVCGLFSEALCFSVITATMFERNTSMEHLRNGKEQGKTEVQYYDKTDLVSRFLREIPRRVSRVRPLVSVARNARKAIRNLNSFNNYFLFSSHCCCCCCCCCSIFGVLFIF